MNPFHKNSIKTLINTKLSVKTAFSADLNIQREPLRTFTLLRFTNEEEENHLLL